jgi:hypothetical protein
MAQTDRQTDGQIGHGDSMTESAQWGRFSENPRWSEISPRDQLSQIEN